MWHYRVQTGVMAVENILEYIKIENSYFEL